MSRSQGASRAFSPPRLRKTARVGTLHIVFGDQLSLGYEPLTSLDPRRDAVLMMEVACESEFVPSHKARTAFFLAAMRHFAIELAGAGHRVEYITLDDPKNTHTFEGEIQRAIERFGPERLTCVHPGEWRVLKLVEQIERDTGVPVEIFDDTHFLTTQEDFDDWAHGRRQLTMEFFYREQRRRLGVLMEQDGKTPVGGEWNLDKLNRKSFKTTPRPPKVYTPRLSAITTEVIDLVAARFPNNYGSLDHFAWPVTREQGKRSLDNFIEHRLPLFGDYEDAMWTQQRVLYHSQLSPLVNVKLLDPRECVTAAVAAYERGHAPLNAVEGFVRQFIGWREFIRGVYWQQGPDYPNRNTLDAGGHLPDFYWTADTDMACLRDCLQSVVDLAWGHHIPRLMVIGNFAMLAGVNAREVADWFLAMYADAVDWASNPNTIGMSQHADGGVVGTKPYAGAANYISKMSNYCENCRYDPKARHGDIDAARPPCPFNSLYWDFLRRHQQRFKNNQRMAMVMKGLERMKPQELHQITITATAYRGRFGVAGEPKKRPG